MKTWKPWVHVLLCPNCAADDGLCLGEPCAVDHEAWSSAVARLLKEEA